MKGFFERNPAVKTLPGKRIESERLKNASTETIMDFFQYFDDPAIKAIPPSDRYNMDEAGIMEGLGVNGLVVGASELRAAHMKEPNRGSWMTFIECISANGNSVDPIVIFRGKTIQQQWFPENCLDDFKGWLFAVSENGWTSNTLAFEWLTKVFIPRTKPQHQGGYRLLVLDGHGSHATDEFMFECFKHRIYLLYLPAHTSHILQPLDLAVFSPLKTSYRKWAQKLYIQTDASPFGRLGFLSCLQKARKEALTSYNIKAGWRASGLWPLNQAKPLLNPRLLPSSTPRPKTPSLETPPARTNQQSNREVICTPKRGADIQALMQGTPSKTRNPISSRQQLVLEKVQKGYDTQAFNLALQRSRIKTLEAKVQQLEPKKKCQVRVNLNEKFVNIEQIMQTKARLAREAEAQKERLKEWEENHSLVKDMRKHSFEEMCFEWQL